MAKKDNETVEAVETEVVETEEILETEAVVEEKPKKKRAKKTEEVSEVTEVETEVVNESEEVVRERGTARKSFKERTLTKRERKAEGIGLDEARATANYVRISAMKVKIVLDLIRGKSLEQAHAIVKFTPKAASEVLTKVLKSAEANAVNRVKSPLNKDALYVAECFANQGPTLKRIMARAQGRAFRINKRTSHITIVLKEK